MGEGTGGRRLRPRRESLWLGEGWTIRFSPPPLFPLPPGEGKLILERIIKNPPSPPFAKGGWGGLYFQMKI